VDNLEEHLDEVEGEAVNAIRGFWKHYLTKSRLTLYEMFRCGVGWPVRPIPHRPRTILSRRVGV
jgi:hypothetical protein